MEIGRERVYGMFIYGIGTDNQMLCYEKKNPLNTNWIEKYGLKNSQSNFESFKGNLL